MDFIIYSLTLIIRLIAVLNVITSNFNFIFLLIMAISIYTNGVKNHWSKQAKGNDDDTVSLTSYDECIERRQRSKSILREYKQR